jgi:hypothetical protein
LTGGVRFPAVARNFSLLHPSFHAMRTEGSLSPGIKRPGHEADHSPVPSAEVKNGGIIYGVNQNHYTGDLAEYTGTFRP